ncbi:hypothetical protein DPMN_043495 [Dreissena polymorpha]|uniref:Uncharacterized protein n=1 Tax=Dreissena polymorpha TaxID=45954 RepID=A0A9D4D2E5_DREPO|nr:hypothetical protein DPMN_043495 [Dreissena polymorpha]
MSVTLVGPHEPLLATVKRQNMVWFGHVTRHESLCKIVLHEHARGRSTSCGKTGQGNDDDDDDDAIDLFCCVCLYNMLTSNLSECLCPAGISKDHCNMQFSVFVLDKRFNKGLHSQVFFLQF